MMQKEKENSMSGTFTNWLKGQAVDAAKDFAMDLFRGDDDDGGGGSQGGLMSGTVRLPGAYSISPDPLDRAARTEMARVVDPMSAMAFYSSAFRAAVRQARGTTRQRLRAKGRVV
jgi:hypothetical protein